MKILKSLIDFRNLVIDCGIMVLVEILTMIKLLGVASKLAKLLHDNYFRSDTLHYVVKGLIEAGRLQEAERLADEIMSRCRDYSNDRGRNECDKMEASTYHDDILERVVEVLIKKRDFDRAREVATKIRDTASQLNSFIFIARASREDKDFSKCRKLLETIDGWYHRSRFREMINNAAAKAYFR